VLPKDTRKYFGDGRDGLNTMFNFFVNQHLFYALASEDVRPLERALLATREIPAPAQWCMFLRNHDELDIERLPDEQRNVVFERFGPDKNMQLYHRGIRRRLASMLGDRRHVELANSILLALPGAPVIRYGDEIGMGEDLSLKERDAVRTPMQWSDEPNAGFSTAKRLVHPVISAGPYSYERVNVAAQRRDPHSLFNWMVRMIRMRKECSEIAWGDWTLLRSGSRSVLAMCFSWRGNRVVTLHNFSNEPRRVKLQVPGPGAELLIDVLNPYESRGSKRGVHQIALPPFGYRWYRVGTLNYALTRKRRGPGIDD